MQIKCDVPAGVPARNTKTGGFNYDWARRWRHKSNQAGTEIPLCFSQADPHAFSLCRTWTCTLEYEKCVCSVQQVRFSY